MISKRYYLILGLIPGLLFATPKQQQLTHAWELPSLILPDLQGIQHNLFDWQGKIIILNFWATWCGPCQIEIPHLKRYQDKYAAKGLQVIGVGLDEKRKLRNFVRTLAIHYPVLHADPKLDYSMLAKWGNVSGTLPYTVVIDRQGQFVLMHQGIFSDQAFTQYVLPLLVD